MATEDVMLVSSSTDKRNTESTRGNDYVKETKKGQQCGSFITWSIESSLLRD